MKKYKLETFIYYSKLTTNKFHIIESSTPEIQEKMDEYSRAGWQLASTNMETFGAALYIYLYFEKDR